MAINIDAILNIAKVKIPKDLTAGIKAEFFDLDQALTGSLQKIASIGKTFDLALNPQLVRLTKVARSLTDLSNKGGDTTQALQALGSALRVIYTDNTKASKVIGTFDKLLNAVKKVSASTDDISFENASRRVDRLKKQLAGLINGKNAVGKQQTLEQLDVLISQQVLGNTEKVAEAAKRTRAIEVEGGYRTALTQKKRNLEDLIGTLNQYKDALVKAGKVEEATSVDKQIGRTQKRLDSANKDLGTNVSGRTDKDLKRTTANLNRQNAKDIVKPIEERFAAFKEQQRLDKLEAAARKSALSDLDRAVNEQSSIYDREIDALKKRRETLVRLGRVNKIASVDRAIQTRENRKAILAQQKISAIETNATSSQVKETTTKLPSTQPRLDQIRAIAQAEKDELDKIEQDRTAKARGHQRLLLSLLQQRAALEQQLSSDNVSQSLQDSKEYYKKAAESTKELAAYTSSQLVTGDDETRLSKLVDLEKERLAIITQIRQRSGDEKSEFFQRKQAFEDRVKEFTTAAKAEALAQAKAKLEAAREARRAAKEAVDATIKDIKTEQAAIRSLAADRAKLAKAASQLSVSISTRGDGATGSDALTALRARIAALTLELEARQKAVDTAKSGLSTKDQRRVTPDPAKPTVGPATTNDLIESAKAAKKVNDQFVNAHINATKFGQAVGLAAKRFSAFIIGSAPIFTVIQAFRIAATEALKFEKQITRIEQVLNKSSSEVSGLFDTIRKAATSTGTGINDIGEGIQLFAQAGIQDIDLLTQAVGALAKVPLAPTFDGVQATVEGLLAVFGQFNKSVGDTNQVLDLLNQYAADFGAESKDFFEGAKRGGSAFQAAGGSLEEFVQLMAVLRETTRESAETLGTFFKTGTSQLLSAKAQGQMKLMGITSTNLTDQLKELSKVLFGKDVSEKDRITRIQGLERLTGERQFARLLSLLQALADPDIQKRLEKTSESVFGSLDRTTGRRLDDIGVSLERVKQGLNAFASSVIQNESLKSFVSNLASVATAITSIGAALAGMLPYLATFAAFKFAPVLGRVNKGITKTLGFGLDLGVGASAKSLIRSGQIPVGQSLKNLQGAASNTLSFALGARGIGNRGLLSGKGRFDSSTVVPLSRADRTAARDLDRPGREALATSLRRERTGGRAFRGAGALAGIAAFAGTGLASGGSSNQLLESGTTGLLVGSLLSGINPLLGVVAGTVVAFKSLNDSIEAVRKKNLADALQQAKGKAAPTFEALEKNKQSRGSRLIAGAGVAFEGAVTFISDIFTDVADSEYKALQREAAQVLGKDRAESGIFNNVGVFATDIDKGLQSIFNAQIQGQIKLITDQLNQDPSSLGGQNLNNVLFKNVIAAVQKETRASGRIFNFEELRIRFQQLLSEGILQLSDLLKRPLDEVVNILDFQKLGDGLRTAFQRNIDNLSSVFDDMGRVGDQLGSVITDLSALVQIQVPTIDSDLFSGAGFDQITKFQTDIVNQFASRLSGIVQDPSFRGSLRNLQEDIQSGSADNGKKTVEDFTTAELFEKNFSGVNATIKDAALVFDQLAAITGLSVTDILTKIGEMTGSTKEFVQDLLKTPAAFDAVKKGVTDYVANLNKERETRKQLNDVLRTLNGQLFDATDNINSAFDTLFDRTEEQKDFVNNLGSIQVAAQKAITATSRALTTQFTNVSGFITDLFGAQTDRTSAGAAAGAANRRGDIKSPAFEQSDAAAARFADLQQQLGQRLSELDNRVGFAVSATDTLRDAFTSFKGVLQSAGAAVTGFTISELGEAFAAFDKFATLSNSFSDIGTGLEGLNDLEFGGLQKILQAAGSFDLGSGISGSDLIGDINQTLGIPLLAAIRSRVTGESTDQASVAIEKELQDLKTAQAQAAAVEASLRQEQISLLQVQAQLIPLEQQFYKDQLVALDNINQTLVGYLAQIQAKVGNLYNNPLPVIGDIKKQDIAAPIVREPINPSRVEVETAVTPPQTQPPKFEGSTFNEGAKAVLEGIGTLGVLEAFNDFMKGILNAFGGNFATGGKVPGTGSKDTVSAMLTPGEYVINKQAASKLGLSTLDKLNKGKVPKFATGGAVGKVPLSANDLLAMIGGKPVDFPVQKPQAAGTSVSDLNQKVANDEYVNELTRTIEAHKQYQKTLNEFIDSPVAPLINPLVGREDRANDAQKTKDFFSGAINAEIIVMERNLAKANAALSKTPTAVDQANKAVAKTGNAAIDFKNKPLAEFQKEDQKRNDLKALLAEINAKNPTSITAAPTKVFDPKAIDPLREEFDKQFSLQRKDAKFIGGQPEGVPLNERDARNQQSEERSKRSQAAFRKVFPDAQFGRPKDNFIGGNPDPNADPLGIKRKAAARKEAIFKQFGPSYAKPESEFIGQNPERKPISSLPDLTAPLDKTTNSLDALNSTMGNYTEIMRKLIDKSATPLEPSKTLVEVAPIQVSVALNAPDVSKLLGDSVYNAVMAQIGPALSEAFGVVSGEAKSVFESRI